MLGRDLAGAVLEAPRRIGEHGVEPAAGRERQQVLGGGASRPSCRGPPARARHLAHQPGEPVDAQAQAHAVDGDVDPLDQQLHDPRLLGREQLVPQRVELQRAPRAPRPR